MDRQNEQILHKGIVISAHFVLKFGNTNLSDELCRESKYKSAIHEIKQEIVKRNGELGFHIESLLSNVEEKKEIIGEGKLNSLTEKEFVEFFTTNYDYLFEMGLEHNDVPYYDGFTGSYEPFFDSNSVDSFNFLPQQTKLWKIHGSLGWSNGINGKIIRKSLSGKNKDILIYRSITKYEHSKKMPYTALLDRLCNFLKQEDTVLFVCGYSFGDDHINERILSGLRNGMTSHVYVLFFDRTWENNSPVYTLTEESKMAQIAMMNPRISVFGCRNAIIGGKYGEWQLKREPDKDNDINISLYSFDKKSKTLV